MSYVLDDKLKEQMQTLRKMCKEKDEDFIMVVTGYEGKGKSTLALEICTEWDENFNIEKITFEPKDFRKTVVKSRWPSAVLMDEGAFSFLSRDAMTKQVKKNMRLLTACRKFNLLIVICIPDFFILDKYIRDHRVRGLLRVTKKGRFFAYNKQQIKKIEKKSGKGIKYPHPAFKGSFGKYKGELWKKFNKKKDEAMLEAEEDKKEKKKANKNDFIINYAKKHPNATQKEIGEVFNLTRRRIGQILRKRKERKNSNFNTCEAIREKVATIK